MYKKENIKGCQLIGIKLEKPTSNKNGQSNQDCGMLWQQFEKDQVFDKIPNKIDQSVLAVYHSYQGDQDDPFSYFIGCKVEDNTKVPDDLSTLALKSREYTKVATKGKMPDCIADGWKKIWQSDINRSFEQDFEVYDERCRDWSNAEVDIYLS